MEKFYKAAYEEMLLFAKKYDIRIVRTGSMKITDIIYN